MSNAVNLIHHGIKFDCFLADEKQREMFFQLINLLTKFLKHVSIFRSTKLFRLNVLEFKYKNRQSLMRRDTTCHCLSDNLIHIKFFHRNMFAFIEDFVRFATRYFSSFSFIVVVPLKNGNAVSIVHPLKIFRKFRLCLRYVPVVNVAMLPLYQ